MSKTKVFLLTVFCGIGLATCWTGTAAHAETMTIFGDTNTFEGTTAYEGQAASATFELINSTVFTVTLSNISTWSVSHQNQVLTGLFFDITSSDSAQTELLDVFQFSPLVNNGNTVTGASVVISSGSSAYNGDTLLSQYSNVGGEWGYKEGAVLSATETAGYGIGASGLQPIGFGVWDRFNANSLTSPASPGGVDWGLRSSVLPSTQTNGLLNQNPLIGNSITATFTVANPNFSALSQIHEVYFYYGSSASEGRMQGDDTTNPSGSVIPEPSSFALLALGLTGVGFCRKRRY